MTDTKEQADAKSKLDEDAKTREAANVDALQKQAKTKPTPTQRENDLAKLGALNIDEKEPDGSEPDPHALKSAGEKKAADEKSAPASKATTADESASSYKTRDYKK